MRATHVATCDVHVYAPARCLHLTAEDREAAASSFHEIDLDRRIDSGKRSHVFAMYDLLVQFPCSRRCIVL